MASSIRCGIVAWAASFLSRGAAGALAGTSAASRLAPKTAAQQYPIGPFCTIREPLDGCMKNLLENDAALYGGYKPEHCSMLSRQAKSYLNDRQSKGQAQSRLITVCARSGRASSIKPPMASAGILAFDGDFGSTPRIPSAAL
jgi:hypothetical protein